MESFKDSTNSDASIISINRRLPMIKLERSKEKIIDPSLLTFLSNLPSIADYLESYFQSKMTSSAFAESLFTIPREFNVHYSMFDSMLDFSWKRQEGK